MHVITREDKFAIFALRTQTKHRVTKRRFLSAVQLFGVNLDVWDSDVLMV